MGTPGRRQARERGRVWAWARELAPVEARALVRAGWRGGWVAVEGQASEVRAVLRADSQPVVAPAAGSKALRLEGVDNNKGWWGIGCQGQQGTWEDSRAGKAEALDWHSRA